MAGKTADTLQKISEYKRIDNLGKFAGHSPGKTKGCMGGRAKALMKLDDIMAKVENLELLGQEFQKEFEAKPLSFFKQYVMPLLPKETKLTGEGIQINITQPEAKELKKANNRLLEQLN